MLCIVQLTADRLTVGRDDTFRQYRAYLTLRGAIPEQVTQFELQISKTRTKERFHCQLDLRQLLVPFTFPAALAVQDASACLLHGHRHETCQPVLNLPVRILRELCRRPATAPSRACKLFADDNALVTPMSGRA